MAIVAMSRCQSAELVHGITAKNSKSQFYRKETEMAKAN